ncbi:MAG: UDP-N-acetylglucosamine 2-epimerase [Herbinix sp.]|nr:UDP-N-acetylglucosamine 2-epimerase [Herbinix sp.]
MDEKIINKYQVCMITGTRAEYGLLRQLMLKIKKQENIELQLVVTGSHLSQKFGNTQDEIIEDGFKDYIKLAIPMDDDSKEGMAISAGVAMTKFAELFTEYKPDIVIVLGDRFEIFAAVAAAHLVGITVVHLSGGDTTEGAVDDAIRHSITKMSHLHFPGCEQSAKRIIQMGEQPDRVFNVGEPGVENCLKMQLISRNELADNLKFNAIHGSYSIVTFHPVTMENNTAVSQVYELIKAMDSFKDMSYIITMANADAGGRMINDIWLREGASRTNWLVVSSLGVLRYLSAVNYAKVVIGNSSSGVIEAPSMGTPTVNIGDRQKGRMMAESVVCCLPERDKITEAIKKVLKADFQLKSKHIVSPFGDGTTSDQIVKRINEYLENKAGTNEKHFYDIEF